MDLQFKTFPFEVKSSAPDGSQFQGLVSVFHNIDSYGEIVDDTAFNADLQDFLENGFIGGLNHNWDNPIGKPQAGTRITEKGLHLVGNIVDTSHGMDVRKLLSNGVVKKLSIGYSTLGTKLLQDAEEVQAYWQSKGYTPNETDLARAEHGATVLTRLKLYEGSPVTVPANDLATITAVKAAQARTLLQELIDDVLATKGATGDSGLPIGPREREWDRSAADKRVRAWADAQDAPNAKYRQAFFWYDEANADKFGAYKLQFADVIDGTLTAIPRGIFACAGVMAGARGGVSIPEADRTGVASKIRGYYSRMREKFDDPEIMPPDMAGTPMKDGAELEQAKFETISDAEDYLRDAGMSRTEAKRFISCLKTLLRDAVGDETDPKVDDAAVSADVTPVEEKASDQPIITPEPEQILPLDSLQAELQAEVDKKRQELLRAVIRRNLEIDAATAQILKRAGS